MLLTNDCRGCSLCRPQELSCVPSRMCSSKRCWNVIALSRFEERTIRGLGIFYRRPPVAGARSFAYSSQVQDDFDLICCFHKAAEHGLGQLARLCAGGSMPQQAGRIVVLVVDFTMIVSMYTVIQRNLEIHNDMYPWTYLRGHTCTGWPLSNYGLTVAFAFFFVLVTMLVLVGKGSTRRGCDRPILRTHDHATRSRACIHTGKKSRDSPSSNVYSRKQESRKRTKISESNCCTPPLPFLHSAHYLGAEYKQVVFLSKVPSESM